MKNIYRAIIFDLDGTITRTNQLIFDSFNYISKKYLDKTFSPDEITRMFGPPEDIAIQRLIGNTYAHQATEEFYQYYEEHHSEKAELYPGIVSLLELLKENRILLGIFTGKGRITTNTTLSKFGIDKFFTAIITGHDVIRHKPSGEGITRAMNTMRVNPNETLMVGDSVADVKAAREAGVDIASVLWDSYGLERVLKLESTFKFFSLDEFSDWIKIQLQTETITNNLPIENS